LNSIRDQLNKNRRRMMQRKISPSNPDGNQKIGYKVLLTNLLLFPIFVKWMLAEHISVFSITPANSPHAGSPNSERFAVRVRGLFDLCLGSVRRAVSRIE
jgi:hypothetical protein